MYFNMMTIISNRNDGLIIKIPLCLESVQSLMSRSHVKHVYDLFNVKGSCLNKDILQIYLYVLKNFIWFLSKLKTQLQF